MILNLFQSCQLSFQNFAGIVCNGICDLEIFFTIITNSNKIKANLITSDGQLMMPLTGISINDLNTNKRGLQVTNLAESHVLITWIENRSTVTEVYGQLLNAEGTPQWPEQNGRSLSQIYTYYPDTQYSIIPDQEGGFIIAYTGDSGEAKAQLLLYDQSGELVSDAPIDVCETISNTRFRASAQMSDGQLVLAFSHRVGDIQYLSLRYFSSSLQPLGDPIELGQFSDGVNTWSSITLRPASDMGLLVAWTTMAYPMMEFYLQKLDSNANLVWNSGGQLTCQYQDLTGAPLLAADYYGGAVVAWSDNPLNSQGDSNRIWVKRLDAAGQLMFLADDLCVSPSPQYLQSATLTGDNLHLAWQGSIGNDTGLQIQNLSINGTPPPPNGGIMLRGGISNPGFGSAALSFVHDQGLTLIWYDTRNPASHALYYQILDNNNVPQLTENGELLIADIMPNTINHRIIPVSTGEVLIVWNSKANGQSSLRAQLLHSSGTMLWGEEGLLVAEDLGEGASFDTTSFGGDFYISWRNSSHSLEMIRGQKIHNGVIQWGAAGIDLLPELDPGYNRYTAQLVGSYLIVEVSTSISSPRKTLIKKLSSEGTNVWQNSYVFASNYQWPNEGNDYAQAVLYGEDLIVAWQETRTGDIPKVYMQRIGASGDYYWDPMGVFALDNVVLSHYSLQVSDDSILFLANSGNYNQARKFDIDTSCLIWDLNPLIQDLCPLNIPFATTYNDGNVLFVFDSSGIESSPKFNYLSSQGALLMPESLPFGIHSNSLISRFLLGGSGSRGYLSWGEYLSRLDHASGYAQFGNHTGIFLQAFDNYSTSNPGFETPAPTSRLIQNYPNPFNPSTTIAYEITKAQSTTLGIYNMRGQLIRTLVDEHKSAGRHTIVWDGKDSSGSSVSSGIYFYRLKSGRLTTSRKMILTK